MGAVSSSPISSPTRQRERVMKRSTSPPAPRCSGSTPHNLMTAPSTVLVSGRCPMGTGRIAEETGLAEAAESNATLADWIRHGRAADPVGTLSGPECRCHQ